MTTIYKYPFTIADSVTIRMPVGARILRVDGQGGAPCLWATVDTDRPVVDWMFRIYGTGHETQGESTHVGTFFQGPFVWHMFLVGGGQYVG